MFGDQSVGEFVTVSWVIDNVSNWNRFIYFNF